MLERSARNRGRWGARMWVSAVAQVPFTASSVSRVHGLGFTPLPSDVGCEDVDTGEEADDCSMDGDCSLGSAAPADYPSTDARGYLEARVLARCTLGVAAVFFFFSTL